MQYVLPLAAAAILYFAIVDWSRTRRAARTLAASPGAALCGRCGYDTRGLPSATCPECGGDLREVGVVRAHSLRPPPYALWLFAWTLGLTTFWGVCVVNPLFAYGPRVRREGISGTHFCAVPDPAATGGTCSMRLAYDFALVRRYWGHAGPGTFAEAAPDMAVTTSAAAGPRLALDPSGGPVVLRDARGAALGTYDRFSLEALTALYAAAGRRVADPIPARLISVLHRQLVEDFTVHNAHQPFAARLASRLGPPSGGSPFPVTSTLQSFFTGPGWADDPAPAARLASAAGFAAAWPAGAWALRRRWLARRDRLRLSHPS